MNISYINILVMQHVCLCFLKGLHLHHFHIAPGNDRQAEDTWMALPAEWHAEGQDGWPNVYGHCMIHIGYHPTT